MTIDTDWMKPYLRYDSISWDEINEGDEMPAVDREIDTTLVVSGAIASRDFYPVHHDKGHAESVGSPDVFLNILTTNGLMAAYVTNWCGPAWDLASIDLRLKIPAFPGQTLHIAGKVTGKREEDGNRFVDVEFSATTDYGAHCTGTATVRLAE